MVGQRLIHVLAAVLLVAVAVSLPATAAVPWSQPAVYVKIFPGREFCVNYEAFRDPEADPTLVTLDHRTLDTRLAGVRVVLYGPSKVPNQRGPVIKDVEHKLDSFGESVGHYFYATESGLYTMCFRSPVHHPVMRYEMRFTGANDIVPPPIVEEEAVVVDKQVEVKDYEQRLSMLDIAVETTREELRSQQLRQSVFSHTMRSAYKLVIGSVLLNVALVVVLSYGTEKYLERYYTKAKVD